MLFQETLIDHDDWPLIALQLFIKFKKKEFNLVKSINGNNF